MRGLILTKEEQLDAGAEDKHWKINTIVFSYDLKKGRFWDVGKENSNQQPERYSE